jgi:predicted ATP-binding protein involved in virulence
VTSVLRLQSVELKNFRSFRRATLHLHPNVTVLVADNGAGKSATLDAVALALGQVLPSAITKRSRGDSSAVLKPSDATAAEIIAPYRESLYPVSISCTADLNASDASWEVSLASSDSRPKVKPSGLSATFESARFEADDLPIVAYYGTGRAMKAKNKKRPELGRVSRHFGFEGALDSSADFRQLTEWLAQAEWERSSQRNSSWDAALSAVYDSTARVLSSLGATSVSYSPEEQDLVVDFRLANGPLEVFDPDPKTSRVPMSLLSDGVRSVLALVADLAFRCAVLNAHQESEAPQLTEGVVLIDEVDMHLHPTWQSRIVNDLTSTFPRIQFILTTHSPLVISSLPRESVLRITSTQGESRYSEIETRTAGASADYVMETVFLAKTRANTEFSSALRELSEALRDQELDHAEKAGNRLRKLLGADFDEDAKRLLRELDRMLSKRTESGSV